MLYISILNLMILIRYASYDRKKLLRELYPLFLVFLYVFSAFRFEVGCDWPIYSGDYALLKYSEGIAIGLTEPMYAATMKFLIFFDLSYVWVNLIFVSVFFYGISMLAKRQPDPLSILILAFPILIINMPMSGIRQGAAIGVLCIAYMAFIDKKTTKYVLTVLLATLFHTSALIFLLLAPFITKELTPKRLIIPLLIVVPGAIALILSPLGQIAIYRYVTLDYEAAGAVFRVGLLVISAGIFFLFKEKWEHYFPEDYKLIVLGSLMMVLCLILIPVSTIIGDRVGYYLIPLQLIIFSRIPYLQIKNFRPFWIALPYLITILVFVVWTYMSTHFDKCYQPYNSWLFGIPDSMREGLKNDFWNF